MSNTASPSAEFFLRRIMECVVGYERQLDALVDQADIAADRIVAGGNLYGLGDEEGFVAEFSGRSGGLTGITEAPDPSDVTDRDFIVAATMDLDTETYRVRIDAYRAKGAHIVLIGSDESKLRGSCDGFVANGVSAGTAPLFSFRGSEICPTASACNISLLWLFVAEFVSACTRRGKMPAFYQSAGIPYGSYRNAIFSKKVFCETDEVNVAPIPARELGRQFLAALHRCLAGILVTEITSFVETGKLAANTIKAGRTVWCDVAGHHLNHQPGLAGDPALFSYGHPEHKKAVDSVAIDDYYIFNGYYTFPEEQFPKYRELGVPSTWILGGRESQSIFPAKGEIHIDPQWRFGDASLYVPGHDIKIIPVSGVVMTTTLWMLVAETAGNLT